MTDDERACLMTYLRASGIPDRRVAEAVASATDAATAIRGVISGATADAALLFYPAYRKGWVACSIAYGKTP